MQKKSKNIFDKLIVNENLQHQETNKCLQIDDKIIQNDWLLGQSNSKYNYYLQACLELAVIMDQLRQHKQASNSSKLKQVDLFRMATLRKQIGNFQVSKHNVSNLILKKNQWNVESLPEIKMMIQKISGLFNTNYLRQCYFKDKKIHIDSKKQQLKHVISFEDYNFQLETKLDPLNRKQFEYFEWVEGFESRMLMIGDNLRCYCLYTDEQTTYNLLNCLKIQGVQLKSMGVFKGLSYSYQQKVITLFGNKARFYQHHIRGKKIQKQKEVEEANLIKMQINKMTVNLTTRKKVQRVNKSIIYSENKEEEISKIQQKKPEIQQAMHSTFRLKGKRITVFYDQIQDAIDLSMSPDVNQKQFNLNLKDDQGISQQSCKLNSIQLNKKFVSQKIIHFEVKDRENQFQINNFNINIHEVSDDQSEQGLHANQIDYNQSQSESGFNVFGTMQRSNEQSVEVSIVRKNTEEIMSQFFLEGVVSKGSGFTQDQNRRRSSPNIQGEIVEEFKSQKNWKFCLNYRSLQIHCQISGIESLLPLNNSTLNYTIFQLDPEIEMSQYFVICAQYNSQFTEKRLDQKYPYTNYISTENSQTDFSQESNEFFFRLRQNQSNLYIKFNLNSYPPKYQVNSSILLLSQNSHQQYTFAGILKMWMSPEMIIKPQIISTIQFMKSCLQGKQQSYKMKYQFIDNKKKQHQLHQKWNLILIKQIINSAQLQAYQRAVYRGIPKDIVSKMINLMPKPPNFKQILTLQTSDLKIIADTLLPPQLFRVRSFMEPHILIKKILQANFNFCLRNRLEQIIVFCYHRYGSCQNLLYVFAKEVLTKINEIILLGKNQTQVDNIIDLYVEVEYQIDQIFDSISKYFLK